MIHAIYLLIVSLLVLAGLYFLNELNKTMFRALEAEENLKEQNKSIVELFEYANSKDEKAYYKLGKWDRGNGEIIEGLKLYNQAYLEPFLHDAILLSEVATSENPEAINVKDTDDNNSLKAVVNEAFCVNLLNKFKEERIKPLKDEKERLEEEITKLKSKLQSAYGRIGNLTQQVNRQNRKYDSIETKESRKRSLP